MVRESIASKADALRARSIEQKAIQEELTIPWFAYYLHPRQHPACYVAGSNEYDSVLDTTMGDIHVHTGTIYSKSRFQNAGDDGFARYELYLYDHKANVTTPDGPLATALLDAYRARAKVDPKLLDMLASIPVGWKVYVVNDSCWARQIRIGPDAAERVFHASPIADALNTLREENPHVGATKWVPHRDTIAAERPPTWHPMATVMTMDYDRKEMPAMMRQETTIPLPSEPSEPMESDADAVVIQELELELEPEPEPEVESLPSEDS